MSEHNPLMRFILLVAASVGISHVVIWNLDLSETTRLGWKFASVGSLALYAALHARRFEGWLLTISLLLCALSDVCLETIGQLPGALSFMAADLVAITLYVRNSDTSLSTKRRIIVGLIIPASAALAYILPAKRDEALGIALFVIPLASMTAFGWASRFPWHFVGVGTTMVLLSDLLIFADMGPLADLPLIKQVIWLLYFIGELAITIGVVRNLAKS